MKNSIKVAKMILFTALLGSYSCASDDSNPDSGIGNVFIWEKIGLDGLKVNSLRLRGNLLYAATEIGLFRKNIDTEEPFIPIGLQGLNIEDFLLLDDEKLLASVADFQDETIIQIVSTNNGGQNWEVMETNFGGGSIDPHIVWKFLKPSESTDVIFATSNYVVAESLDGGFNWTLIWGEWDVFARATSMVGINPSKPNEIWLGGQGAIEDGYLVKLENRTETNRWLDLVPNPTTPKKIVFDNLTPQNIYVGFEGALIRTSSNGQSWETLIDEHESARFFNGIGINEQNNNRVYAAGWLKTDEPQPLILYYSNDKGATWLQDHFKEESFGGVEDMVLISEGNQDRIFLGLNKGGVYEVKSNQ
ncbi:MAG: hypothetical protein KKC03_09720 [Bacteroidetes bacterium]|nr:hypothetical protein [Bacteroidota bacterium]